jgi:polyphosphate glucokinase
MTHALGIDIGGTGIKGAPVDTATGILLEERFKLDTPQPSTPRAVAATVARVAQHFSWDGPVGVAFPGIIIEGQIELAANMGGKIWIGKHGPTLFRAASSSPVRVVNDADAAGIAEMTFGAGKGETGLVYVLTFGTGIGVAVFNNGVLVPNCEEGHIEIRGKEAEHRCSAKVRDDEGLNMKQWAARVSEYLQVLELLHSPSLFIIGGGISRKSDQFLHMLVTTRARVLPAAQCNNAGIVGAAMKAVI